MTKQTAGVIVVLAFSTASATIGCSGAAGVGGSTSGGSDGTTSSGGAPGPIGSGGVPVTMGSGGAPGPMGSGGAMAADGGVPNGSGGRPATTPDAGTDGTVTGTGGRPADAGTTGSGGAPNGTGGRGGQGGQGAGATGGTTPPPITIWLAGDSTVQDYPAGNTEGNGGTSLEGWGQELAPFFNTQVVVSNQAIGGRSVAFFMWAVQRDAAGNYLCVDDQGNPNYQLDAAGNHVDTSQWARIKAGIKAGDFLLIQFGTNDETHDCPRFVSLPDFQTDLGLMADTVRARGATPIFVTPMSHRSFVGATINNTLLPYANAMKAEATVKTVEVEDLNLRSVEYFNMAGNAFLATNIFDTGTTHFIRAGAVKMAELIVGEIRAHRGPLAAYLR